MLMLRKGRTIPLYSAPESMSHRLFCQGAYGSPEAFLGPDHANGN